jgi:hypothetical protein
LGYWLRGNTPVILVYSKPSTGEAYWVSIKDYFADPSAKLSKKIVFDKERDRFDGGARTRLERVAIPRGSGLYLGTPAREEILHSDLVPIRSIPNSYCVAPSITGSAEQTRKLLQATRSNYPRGWVQHGGMIYSFEPFTDPIWRYTCEVGAEEENRTDEWSQTEEPDRKRVFVSLFNATLKDQLFGQEVLFSFSENYFYERAPEGLQPKQVRYSSRTRKSRKTSFKKFEAIVDGKSYFYCRHLAFFGRFLRFDQQWYLHIVPTYHFTTDGKEPSPYAGEKRSGIKRLEKNQAVHGNVLFWARRLQQQSDWKIKPRKLFFSEPLKFNSELGLDDNDWRSSDEETEETEEQL